MFTNSVINRARDLPIKNSHVTVRHLLSTMFLLNNLKSNILKS